MYRDQIQMNRVTEPFYAEISHTKFNIHNTMTFEKLRFKNSTKIKATL